MGCLLGSAREANGFLGFPTPRAKNEKDSGSRRDPARHTIEAIERRMEAVKIGAEPRKPFPGLAACPRKSNVCVCPKEEGATHAGQDTSQVT
jgi:hypothetical protein